MTEAFQVQLAAVGDEVRAAVLPTGCKKTVAWCLGKLPDLYAKFRQSNDCRYGNEITRFVQAALKELDATLVNCPEAKSLGAGIIDRLRRLHDRFGVPALTLKMPAVAQLQPRKKSVR